MPDDKYLISPLPKPEGTQLAPHPKERWRTTVAIAIAFLAAAFAAWQAYEAHQTRIESQAAAARQSADVERARKAAEDSAKASRTIAEASERSASASEAALVQSTKSATQSMQATASMQRAYVILALPRINMISNAANQNGLNMQFEISNIGLTAAREMSDEVRCDFFEQATTVTFSGSARASNPINLAPAQKHLTGLQMFGGVVGGPLSLVPFQQGEILYRRRRGHPVCIVTVRYQDVFGGAHQTQECLADWAIRAPLTVETRPMSACERIFDIKPPLKNF